MKSYLKTGKTSTEIIADFETGEVLDITIKKETYLANTKEEFWLMYSSMILILKSSTDIKIKLFASLLERYSQGQEFSLSKGLKEIIAKEVDCSARSLDNAFTALVKLNIIVKIDNRVYKVNPRHIFQGSSKERNKELKVILELHCAEC